MLRLYGQEIRGEIMGKLIMGMNSIALRKAMEALIRSHNRKFKRKPISSELLKKPTKEKK